MNIPTYDPVGLYSNTFPCPSGAVAARSTTYKLPLVPQVRPLEVFNPPAPGNTNTLCVGDSDEAAVIFVTSPTPTGCPSTSLTTVLLT